MALPDSTERFARRVIDEFTRSGELPADLRREMKVDMLRKGVSLSMVRQVERQVFEWAERFCREVDNRRAFERKPEHVKDEPEAAA